MTSSKERPLAPSRFMRTTPNQPGGGRNRAALVTKAHAAIKEGSKSFASSSRLFDKRTRERVWLLYAWCRRCDDIADAQDMGRPQEDGAGDQSNPEDRLKSIRVLTDRAFEGLPTADVAFDAFGLVARECGITREMADDVIAGFALDAKDWRPRSEGDLLQYCYHVAGTVGVMMAVVMGVPPDDEETLDRACDLGLAFQLVDDALDYGGMAAELGKNTGDDFREGKITLPVIIARRRGRPEDHDFWARALDTSRQEESDLARAIHAARFG